MSVSVAIPARCREGGQFKAPDCSFVLRRQSVKAHLLSCFDLATKAIGKTECKTRVAAFRVMHAPVIDTIRMKHVHVCNGGIRLAANSEKDSWGLTRLREMGCAALCL